MDRVDDSAESRAEHDSNAWDELRTGADKRDGLVDGFQHGGGVYNQLPVTSGQWPVTNLATGHWLPATSLLTPRRASATTLSIGSQYKGEWHGAFLGADRIRCNPRDRIRLVEQQAGDSVAHRDVGADPPDRDRDCRAQG